MARFPAGRCRTALQALAGEPREGPWAGASPRGQDLGELRQPAPKERTREEGGKNGGPRQGDPNQARRAKISEVAYVRFWLKADGVDGSRTRHLSAKV